MSKQPPSTTVLNLLQSGRDLELGKSLYSPEIKRAVESARIALTDDGRATAEAVADLNWQRVTWYLETPVNGANVSLEHVMPQGGVLRLIHPRAKAPATGGSLIIAIACSSWSDTEQAAFPAGVTSGQPSRLKREIVPGSVLSLNVISAAGVTGLTVTAFYSPLGG